MAILLDKFPEMIITEKFLEAAGQTASLDAFKLLVARTARTAITEDVLKKSIVRERFDKTALLVDRAEDSSLTPSLIVHAMT